MLETLLTLLSRFAGPLLFLGIFLEALGVPFPAQTLLLVGAVLAERGLLAPGWILGLAFAAAVFGDNLAYLMGHRRSPFFLRKLPSGRAQRAPEHVGASQFRRLFQGTVDRFSPGRHAVASIAAGVARTPWLKFLGMQALEAALWTLTLGVAGFALGGSWQTLHRWGGRAGVWTGALGACLVLLGVAYRHRAALRERLHRLPGPGSLRAGLVLATNALLFYVFAEIAEDVVNRESSALDRSVALAVHRMARPGLDEVMRAFTFVGSAPVVLAAVAAVVLWALRRHQRRVAAVVAGWALLTELINLVLKLSFRRVRPSLWHDLATLHSYSFPSGHSMSAAALFGLMAVVLARLHPPLTRLLAWGTPLLVACIGFSRIYLGAHWPTDVLAGFTAGAFMLLAGLLALGRAEQPVSTPVAPGLGNV